MAGWRVSVGNCGCKAPPSWPHPQSSVDHRGAVRESQPLSHAHKSCWSESAGAAPTCTVLECTELWDEISELARTGRLRLHCHRDGQAVTQLSRCQRVPSEPTLRFREEAALCFSHLAPPIRLCEPFGLGSLLGLQVHFLRERHHLPRLVTDIRAGETPSHVTNETRARSLHLWPQQGSPGSRGPRGLWPSGC